MNNISPVNALSEGPEAPQFVNVSLYDFDEYAALLQNWDLQTWIFSNKGFRADLLHYVDPLGAYHFAHSRFHSPLRFALRILGLRCSG